MHAARIVVRGMQVSRCYLRCCVTPDWKRIDPHMAVRQNAAQRDAPRGMASPCC
ncbi:hypothetical protein R52603_01426 [Paraburkholderia saeva]|nr:hypothetical protein R52603_01426 [Paraburkholderia saeva]